MSERSERAIRHRAAKPSVAHSLPWGRALLLTTPGVLLVVAGMLHPHRLDDSTAQLWWQLHIVALPLFPLIGLAVSALTRGRPRPLQWGCWTAAFVYSAFYGALDVLAGIGTGRVTDDLGAGGGGGAIGVLFTIGDQLALVGVLAFVVLAVAVAADHVVRLRARAAVPSVLLAAAALSYTDSHIFPWRGVLTVLVIGLATGWLALLGDRDATSAE